MSRPPNHAGKGLPAGIEMPNWTDRAAVFGIKVTDSSFDEQTVTFEGADGQKKTIPYKEFRDYIRFREHGVVSA